MSYLLILMLLASYGSTRRRSCRETPRRIFQSVSNSSSKPTQGENNNLYDQEDYKDDTS